MFHCATEYEEDKERISHKLLVNREYDKHLDLI